MMEVGCIRFFLRGECTCNVTHDTISPDTAPDESSMASAMRTDWLLSYCSIIVVRSPSPVKQKRAWEVHMRMHRLVAAPPSALSVSSSKLSLTTASPVMGLRNDIKLKTLARTLNSGTSLEGLRQSNEWQVPSLVPNSTWFPSQAAAVICEPHSWEMTLDAKTLVLPSVEPSTLRTKITSWERFWFEPWSLWDGR